MREWLRWAYELNIKCQQDKCTSQVSIWVLQFYGNIKKKKMTVSLKSSKFHLGVKIERKILVPSG